MDEGRRRTARRILVSTLVVVPIGTALHFVYEWTGRHPMAGIFAPLNESTWEHLKLAFWPMLVYAFVQRVAYHRPAAWLPATAAGLVTAPLLIVLLFYGYTAILGTHHLPLDVTVYALSVLGGEAVAHLLMERTFSRRARITAAVVILVLVAAFVGFTIAPPDSFLFTPPG